MSTQDLTSQEEKAKLWAELDAGDTAPKTVEQAPAKTAAPTESAPAVQAGAEQGADDPFAGVPDSFKHEVLGMRSQMEQLTQRLRNAEGHIGGLNSQLKQQAQRAAKEVAAGGGDAPTSGEIQAAQGSNAAMRKLKEEYPEFGSAMEAALIEDRANRPAPSAPAGPAPDNVTREELQAQVASLTVEASHKGWQEKVKTPAFAGWLQLQAREVQMLAASSEPADAIRLLDLHAAAATQTTATRTQRQASAAAIPMGRGGAIRTKSTEQMTKQELWDHLDAIEAQKG